MAVVEVTVATIYPGPVRLGFRYDDATMLVTHIGGDNRGQRPVLCELTGLDTRQRVVANSTAWRDVSSLRIHVTLEDDPQMGEGDQLASIPYSFRTDSS